MEMSALELSLLDGCVYCYGRFGGDEMRKTSRMPYISFACLNSETVTAHESFAHHCHLIKLLSVRSRHLYRAWKAPDQDAIYNWKQ